MGEKLDAIIFGATGFTGKIVASHAVETFSDLKWGIAGRNEAKLQNVLCSLEYDFKKDMSNISIIKADLNDENSIREMAKRCKILLNCCGPFRLYGEVVVKSCVIAGTHHLDVSGEPDYLNKILNYDSLAKERGVYVISTCGFASIPAEIGVLHIENIFPGDINSIEMYWENNLNLKNKFNKSLLNHGTWDSVVYGMKNAKELLTVQNKSDNAELPPLKPKLKLKLLQKPEFTNKYFIPFPATDQDVVTRTQQLRYKIEKKHPIQFKSYIGFRSLLVTLLLPIYALFLLILSQFSFTRKILLKFPSVFTFGTISMEGPVKVNMESQHFHMTFIANGWTTNHGEGISEKTNKKMMMRISGFSPFYDLTAVSLLLAARTILTEESKLPGSGGVLTPGAAFAKTDLIKALTDHKNGFTFENLEGSN